MSWQFFDSAGNLQVATNSTAAVSVDRESYFVNMTLDSANTVTQTLGNSTSYVHPIQLAYPLGMGFMRYMISGNGASTTLATTANGTGSASIVHTINHGLYTRGTGANSTSLQLYASTSHGVTQQWSHSANANGSQYTVSYRMTYPRSNGSSSFSTSQAVSQTAVSLNTNIGAMTDFTSAKLMDMDWATNIPAGVYRLVSGISSNTGSGGSGTAMVNARFSSSFYAMSQPNFALGELGAATNSSVMMMPQVGSFSIAAGATTASIEVSRVSSSAGHAIPFVALHKTASS